MNQLKMSKMQPKLGRNCKVKTADYLLFVWTHLPVTRLKGFNTAHFSLFAAAAGPVGGALKAAGPVGTALVVAGPVGGALEVAGPVGTGRVVACPVDAALVAASPVADLVSTRFGLSERRVGLRVVSGLGEVTVVWLSEILVTELLLRWVVSREVDALLRSLLTALGAGSSCPPTENKNQLYAVSRDNSTTGTQYTPVHSGTQYTPVSKSCLGLPTGVHEGMNIWPESNKLMLFKANSKGSEAFSNAFFDKRSVWWCKIIQLSIKN